MTTELTIHPKTYVEHPDKLLRIASVARAMLEEARRTPCDPVGCERLREIYQHTRDALADLLSHDLRTELMLMTPGFSETPSPSELRVAQAELVGWLEGLFSGIAAAVGELETDDRPAPGQYL